MIPSDAIIKLSHICSHYDDNTVILSFAYDP